MRVSIVELERSCGRRAKRQRVREDANSGHRGFDISLICYDAQNLEDRDNR